MSITLILFLQRTIIQKLFIPIKIFIKSDKMLTIFESSWQALMIYTFFYLYLKYVTKLTYSPTFQTYLQAFSKMKSGCARDMLSANCLLNMLESLYLIYKFKSDLYKCRQRCILANYRALH